MASAPATVPAGFGFADLPQRPLPPLQPGAWALTREAVERWMGRAKRGEQLVYARGPRLLQSDGVRALQELHDAGAVTFTSRRIALDDIAFIAQRLEGGRKPAERERLAIRSRGSDTAEELAALMAVIRRTAAKRLPLPFNRELGEQVRESLKQEQGVDFGPVSPDRVSYLLGILIRERRITVEALAKGRRVATVLSTGKQTARGE